MHDTVAPSEAAVPLSPVSDRARASVALFAASLFASAFLLFSLQPMVAKVLLPTLGGTPMVWNTCMVFFQTLLLAGYGAAHAASRRHAGARAALLYAIALAAGILVLPLAFQRTPDVGARPGLWLLLELTRVAALPVIALSMSAPVLQTAFSRSRLPGARDPYFLYAASNAGSLLALLLYPTVIEPYVGLEKQAGLWAAAYIAFAVAAGACVIAARRNAPQSVDDGAPSMAAVANDAPASQVRWQRFRWIVLGFLPSSLMLGVTTHISTDIAAVPLIWIIPLALYLATFVIAFGAASNAATRWAERLMPLLAVTIAFEMAAHVSVHLLLSIPLHLAAFTAIALMCHGRLAAERPGTDRLTEFYFLLSLGGVAGGIFNTLLAPLLFSGVAEYPIALALACAVPALRWRGTSAGVKRDLVLAVGVGALFTAIALGGPTYVTANVIRAACGAIAVVVFSQSRRLLRFPLMVAAILLASNVVGDGDGTLLHAERTFFGTYRLTDEPSGRFRMLLHGTTLHGMAWRDASRRLEPLTYYHRRGPFGQAFERLPVMRMATEAAVVGLGGGSLAAYATAETQRWTFYEIDPAVERIARDSRRFGFLEACATRCTVVLGDARLSLERTDARYDFMVLDAFSSDSIPMHLVTREALDMYVQHLKPGGILLFHISNRYLALDHVLARLANEAGLMAVKKSHRPDAAAMEAGETASAWLAASANRDAIETLKNDLRWQPVRPPSGTPLWTDDFSNILAALRVQIF